MITYLCNESPWPTRNGGRARMAGIVEALSDVHEVEVVVARGPQADPVDPRAVALPQASRSRGRSFLSREPFLGRRMLGPDAVAEVVSRSRRADLVLVSHSYLAALLPRLDRPVLVDLQNLEVDRQASQGGVVGRFESLKARRWEPRVVRAAAGVMCVDDRDAQQARAWGARHAIVVPNVSAVPVSPPSPPDGPVVAIADWRYGPNAAALDVLVEHVIPRLQHDLVLAGRGSERAGGLGFVEDLDALYDKASVVVSCVQSGAGTQLKVVEALTRGRVVVTTDYGIRSLPPGAPADGLVTAAPQGMAAAAARLVADVADRHRREQLLREAPMARSWRDAAAPLLDLIAETAHA